MKSPVFACLLALLPVFASADDLTGRVGVGGSLAAGIPVGTKWTTDRNDTGLGLGGWASYGLDRRWSARLGYDNLDFSRGPARLEALNVGAGFALAPDSAWNPSVKAGVGSAFPRHTPAGRQTTIGTVLGLGVDRFLCRNFSVGATLDWLYSFRGTRATRPLHAVRAGLTAGLWFGGRTAAPAQAAAPAPTRAPAPAPAPVVSIALTPVSATLEHGASQTFAAAVSGSQNQSVTWSVEPPLGAVSPVGVYTAPDVVAAAQTVTVTANSLADATKKASSQVFLKAPEKVEVQLHVEFDTAKDVVKAQYDDELKKVASFLKDYPGAKAEIEGHTDNVGDAEYNRGLSQRRADAVRKALIDRFGADAARLTAKGFGPDHPLADNGAVEGRAKNRRVVATFSATK